MKSAKWLTADGEKITEALLSKDPGRKRTMLYLDHVHGFASDVEKTITTG
jgi:hypothetical protein